MCTQTCTGTFHNVCIVLFIVPACPATRNSFCGHFVTENRWAAQPASSSLTVHLLRQICQTEEKGKQSGVRTMRERESISLICRPTNGCHFLIIASRSGEQKPTPKAWAGRTLLAYTGGIGEHHPGEWCRVWRRVGFEKAAGGLS